MSMLTATLSDSTQSSAGIDLRAAQSRLRDALRAPDADNDPVLVAAWIDASDRIADSIDTLAHVLGRDAATASG